MCLSDCVRLRKKKISLSGKKKCLELEENFILNLTLFFGNFHRDTVAIGARGAGGDESRRNTCSGDEGAPSSSNRHRIACRGLIIQSSLFCWAIVHRMWTLTPIERLLCLLSKQTWPTKWTNIWTLCRKKKKLWMCKCIHTERQKFIYSLRHNGYFLALKNKWLESNSVTVLWNTEGQKWLLLLLFFLVLPANNEWIVKLNEYFAPQLGYFFFINMCQDKCIISTLIT